MSDISDKITAFENSQIGEQVRSTLVDLLDALNDNSDDVYNLLEEFYHGGIYRGKSLGSGATFEAASTEAQRAAIADGTFKDMFVGDYWTVDNKIFRIADFNYWKGIGDTAFNTNHVVIVPDASLASGKMNETNDTTGAYIGSFMYSDPSSALNTARATIQSLFGDYVATYRSYLPNAISSGAESAGAWYDASIELMSEIMVYGNNIKAARSTGGTRYVTSDPIQLALFKLNQYFITKGRYNFWLRDVVSATAFARVNAYGLASYAVASNSYGVRPAFPLKGTKN